MSFNFPDFFVFLDLQLEKTHQRYGRPTGSKKAEARAEASNVPV